jgi:glycosyltransferase involved in cell wall biosynthesis
MNKNLSIIIPLKNRTNITVEYEPIQLKTFCRHNLELTGFKNNIKINNNIKLNLLINCLESLKNIKRDNEHFEIILVDFNSDDIDVKLLETNKNNFNIRVIKENDYFSRGKGLNIGLKHSSNDNILFCDADMMFKDHELFDSLYKEIHDGKVFFPICLDLCEPTHQLGYWRTSGYGICGLNKNLLEKHNYKWSEYDTLGKEDNDFWSFFDELNLTSRYKVKGYYHQWHPPNKEFKNKFYKNSDYEKKKIFINVSNENLKTKLINNFSNNNFYISNDYEANINYIVLDGTINNLNDAIKYKKYNKKTILYIIPNNTKNKIFYQYINNLIISKKIKKNHLFILNKYINKDIIIDNVNLSELIYDRKNINENI